MFCLSAALAMLCSSQTVTKSSNDKRSKRTRLHVLPCLSTRPDRASMVVATAVSSEFADDDVGIPNQNFRRWP
jgi:hypothetical protein